MAWQGGGGRWPGGGDTGGYDWRNRYSQPTTNGSPWTPTAPAPSPPRTTTTTPRAVLPTTTTPRAPAPPAQTPRPAPPSPTPPPAPPPAPPRPGETQRSPTPAPQGGQGQQPPNRLVTVTGDQVQTTAARERETTSYEIITTTDAKGRSQTFTTYRIYTTQYDTDDFDPDFGGSGSVNDDTIGDASDSSTGSNVGKIIGGVVGAIAVLLILAIVGAMMYRRRKGRHSFIQKLPDIIDPYPTVTTPSTPSLRMQVHVEQYSHISRDRPMSEYPRSVRSDDRGTVRESWSMGTGKSEIGPFIPGSNLSSIPEYPMSPSQYDSFVDLNDSQSVRTANNSLRGGHVSSILAPSVFSQSSFYTERATATLTDPFATEADLAEVAPPPYSRV